MTNTNTNNNNHSDNDRKQIEKENKKQRETNLKKLKENRFLKKTLSLFQMSHNQRRAMELLLNHKWQTNSSMELRSEAK